MQESDLWLVAGWNFVETGEEECVQVGEGTLVMWFGARDWGMSTGMLDWGQSLCRESLAAGREDCG